MGLIIVNIVKITFVLCIDVNNGHKYFVLHKIYNDQF